MKKLNFKSTYDNGLDNEVIDLCNALNSLPGITTFESCCGHSSQPFSIWFNVNSSITYDGLFFITRCIDSRYWKYGYLWSIKLVVGDVFKNNILPIHYVLSSNPIVGEDAYTQAKDLIKNMNQHLNHKAFIKGFNINLNNFIIK